MLPVFIMVTSNEMRQVHTSLTDANRYRDNDISVLYRNRWEIELGYRGVKQSLLDHRWNLRSQLPGLVRQELWGILLTHNLVRYQMKQIWLLFCVPVLNQRLSF